MLGLKTRRTAVGALLASMALCPGVAHAAGWLSSTPVHLSTDLGPSVAIDASGNMLFAWQHNNPSPPEVIQGAQRLVGSNGFVELPDFSTDTAAGHNNNAPVVVTNRSGNGLVAWINHTPGTDQIQLRPISPGGTVGPVQTFLTAAISDIGVTAAINSNGDAVVAWLSGGNTEQAVTRQGVSGPFTLVKTMTGAGDQGPRVAIDGAGNSIVVWRNGNVIEAQRHLAGDFTTWQGIDPALVGGSDTFSDPVVAANAAGQMVVAFTRTTATTELISDVTGTVAGGWSTTIGTLSPPGVTHGPAASVDDGGGAAVGWSTASGVQVSIRPAGGSFPLPPGVTSVTPVPAVVDNLTLAGNAAGAVIVAWYSFEASAMQNVVRAAVKPPGAATFGASQLVSDPARESTNPVIALDQGGDGVIGFQIGNIGSPLGIGSVIYDNTPPQLSALTGPASVQKGAPAMFSATATDAFSPVTLTWSFGDGSAAGTGSQVSHAFLSAGTFTVTVTATDAAGNATSASRSITVTNPAPPPPPPKRCVVPKLKGKTLSRARTLLTRANCKLGKVTKPKARKHHKLRKLVVGSTSPRAGTVKPLGAKVAVTLVQVPKPKPKHKKHK
jgi:hypothetical protein